MNIAAYFKMFLASAIEKNGFKRLLRTNLNLCVKCILSSLVTKSCFFFFFCFFFTEADNGIKNKSTLLFKIFAANDIWLIFRLKDRKGVCGRRETGRERIIF